MDIISLKEYIFEKQKIEYVLNEIGCHDILYHDSKGYYSCANYNGDNTGAINVKNNPYLNVKNWTREKDFDENADLITLVEYNQKLSFIEAIKYLHKILGLDFKWNGKPQKKPKKKNDVLNMGLEIFTKHSCKRKVDVSDIHVLNEELLHDYIPLLYIGWFREGVMPWTAKKFGLAYSYTRKRVIIPMRYWLTGELLGVNSRTTVENYDELGIKKFFITPTYQKSLNLFGLWENKELIQKAGYVVIYESEKSVLKRDSLNDPTGVALSGHTISDEQVRILIGLNVDIIVSMDNDIPIEEIRHICEKFNNIRNVYYTYDKWNLLGKKDSIADKENKIFKFLLNHKVKYDAEEHRKYLINLGNK